MHRRARPLKKKVKGKRPPARKPAKNEGATVHAYEQRLAESLEREQALSEILRVISSSPTDVQPVFGAIIASAVRLCDATFGVVFQFHDGQLHVAALTPLSPEERNAYHTMYPRPPHRSFIMGRAFLDGRPAHVEDVLADQDYDPRMQVGLQRVARYRTVLAVPILRNGVPIGVVGCARREVKPFTSAQIELVKTFADQAVIAIENVRLFKELEGKNRELTSALDQQTATSEILRTISNSPTDLQPVFDMIVETVVQLCGGVSAFVYRFDGHLIHLSAHHHTVTSQARDVFERRYPAPPSRMSMIAQAILDRTIVHVHDFENDPDVMAASRDMA
jgi:two-component system NtrC family sensor kinase